MGLVQRGNWSGLQGYRGLQVGPQTLASVLTALRHLLGILSL